MEKLIELLNEYEKERGTNRVCYGVDIGVVMSEGITYRFSYVISKEYGFIKWLVENDKIDIEKVIDTAKSSVIDTYYYEEGIDDIYIPLLMVLAIQDSPIEYLLSVIK